MARESTAILGSGISVLREGLAPGRAELLTRLGGTNSVVINYEDINSCMGLSASSAVNATDTPAQLTPVSSRLRGRRKIVINNGATVVFIGPSTVTAANGLRLAVGATLHLDVLDIGDIYIVTASGTSDVRILELK